MIGAYRIDGWDVALWLLSLLALFLGIDYLRQNKRWAGVFWIGLFVLYQVIIALYVVGILPMRLE